MSLKLFSRHHIFLRVIPYLVLVVVSFFPIFMNLGKFHIRMWDEATYANNAIDMLSSNNMMVVEHLDKPDLYNTKPPLAIWLQAVSMKIVGINEWAVRLPSAIFGLLTIFITFYFCKSIIGNPLVGFISALVLLTSRGFVSTHVVRTGDLDAILVFWLTAGLFIFIDLVINKPNNKSIHLISLAVVIIGGFLTKGIAGFFFLPVFLVISCIPGNQWVFRERKIYYAAIATMLMCGGYYVIRESIAPGYLTVVWETEIVRYGSEVMSWHSHPFDFYFRNLLDTRFSPYLFALPFTLICLWLLKLNKLRIYLYLAITAVCYFLFISFSEIKLAWYDAPLFPILSVLIGLTFVETGLLLVGFIKMWNDSIKNSILFGLAMLCMVKPYIQILEVTKYPESSIYGMELDAAYMKFLSKNHEHISGYTVLKKEKNIELYDQVLFYKRAYEIEKGQKIKITQDTIFKTGEILLISNDEDKAFIQKKYIVRSFDRWRNRELYEIVQLR